MDKRSQYNSNRRIARAISAMRKTKSNLMQGHRSTTWYVFNPWVTMIGSMYIRLNLTCRDVNKMVNSGILKSCKGHDVRNKWILNH